VAGASALGLAACNAIFGIHEGKPGLGETGSGGSGGSSGSATSSSGEGGSGGAAVNPACGPSACADGDYQPGGPCEAKIIYQSVGNEDQDLEGTGILSDAPRKRVLWGKGDGSAIVATPIEGGPSTELISAPVAPGAHYPFRLARDDENLYWITFYDGSLARFALEGAVAAVKVAGAPGIGFDRSIALFGDHVFFATMVASDEADAFCNDPVHICTDKLFAAPRSASGAVPTVVYEDATSRFRIGGIASDAVSVYFTTCFETKNEGKVYRVEGPMAKPTAIASFDAIMSSCGEIVADPGPSGRLYWIGMDTLWTSLKDGSELGAKANAPGASRLVADDEYLYWVGHSREILRAPKNSAGPAVVIGAGKNILGLAVDCDHLYWTNTPLINEPGSTIEIKRALR
jgi:hypothetical protein